MGNKPAKKRIWIVLATVAGIFLIVMTVLYLTKDIWENVTDINQYEELLGVDGKYKNNLVGYNDIFPDSLDKVDNVEAFKYIYYNPWDPNYFGYLVCSYSEALYEEEVARLNALDRKEYEGIYGIEKFPYELCAVYADDAYGIIYALTDKEEKKIVYVALEFCNYFTDIKYEKKMETKYLPIGFNANPGNERRKAFDERSRGK